MGIRVKDAPRVTAPTAGDALLLDGATTRSITKENFAGTLGTHAADIASAATLNLEAAAGDMVDVTGTTTITAVTLADGHVRTVRFTGSLTLTNGASLVLPGGANIATAAGDFAIFRGYATGIVRCTVYQRANGAALVGWSQPQGRLTLTSGTAITTADVTGATTLYYTPAVGNICIIYDGTNYIPTVFAQLSQLTTDATKSPAAVAASKVYDIFLWNDSGTLRATRGPAWSSDTSRGTGAGTSEIDFTTALPTNKIAITNGPAANRGVLVGSVRSDASSQLKDTVAFRWVSNIYNTAPRSMIVTDPATSANYSTNTFRQANANAANQLDLLQSLPGNLATAKIVGSYANSTAGASAIVAVQLDSISGTAINAATINSNPSVSVGGSLIHLGAEYCDYPGLGRHTLIWTEWSAATATGTFYYTIGTVAKSGIQGSILN